MGPTGKVARVVLVYNLDRTWGRLDTGQCTLVAKTKAKADYPRTSVYRTPNNRWYVETEKTRDFRLPTVELSLDDVMNWLCDRYGREFPSKFRLLPYLPDVASTPDPTVGVRVVVKCASCLAREREQKKLIRANSSSKASAILACLAGSDGPLSAKEIAIQTGMKADSGLRNRLSQLVVSGMLLKAEGRKGYVLSRQRMS